MDRVVEGYIDGVYYAVEAKEAATGAADTIGVVSGAVAARRLLEFHSGQPLPHSVNVLDVSDADMVMQALQEPTHVIHVRPAAAEESYAYRYCVQASTTWQPWESPETVEAGPGWPETLVTHGPTTVLV